MCANQRPNQTPLFAPGKSGFGNQAKLVFRRSEDGRGPLWWANEFKREDIKELLRKYKIREDLVDSQGKLPSDLA